MSTVTTPTHLVGGTTKYLGPTETKGSRIKVTIHGESKTFPMSYSAHNPHVEAFVQMVEWLEYAILPGKPNMLGHFDDEAQVQFVADSETGKGSVYVVPVLSLP